MTPVPGHVLYVFGSTEPSDHGPSASKEEMIDAFADTGAFDDGLAPATRALLEP